MRLSFALLSLVSLGCAASEAAPPQNATLDRIAREFFEKNGLPGLAIGVVRNDSVLLAKGFGMTDVGSHRAVTESTLFHIASITKPFVATCVMQLVEQGKVDLDQPVARYVPYFAMKDPDAGRITVRQVLTHTAGLPDVTDYAWDKPEYDAGALERYIRGLKDSTLISRPGEKWAYSNIGFELLADLVAVVSGEPFEDYVQRHIMRPLGMSKSTLLMTDMDSSLMARGHESDSATAPFQLAPNYPYNRRHAGSSTVHSNALDMLRWARANMNRGTLDGATILRPASYDSLWHLHRDMTPELRERAKRAGIAVPYDSWGIGLSWFLVGRNGGQLVTHGGGDEGFRSDLLLDPRRKIGVILLTNAGTRASLQTLSLALLDAAAERR